MFTVPLSEIFEERERSEIGLAHVYATQFKHGTSGHLGYNVTAKLAALLKLYVSALSDAGVKYDTEYLKNYLNEELNPPTPPKDDKGDS